MRTKVTLVLVFLNVALFFFIFKFERGWRTERASLEARRRVLGPETADIRTLRITGPELPTISLKRTGDDWSLTEPIDWPANPHAVSRIVNELQFLEHETSFTVRDLEKNGQSLADYGLANPRLSVTFTSGAEAGQSVTLQLGDETKVGNRLYVLSADGSRVHVVNLSLARSLALPVEELRADTLFTIPVFEARSLTLQNSANLRVRLRREASRWSFEAPIIARANKTGTELAINALYSLRVRSFTAPAGEPVPGAAPTLRITLEGNNRRETLVLGTELGTTAIAEAATSSTTGTTARPDIEFSASLEGKPAVFTVAIPGALLDALRNAQEVLRETRILDFEPAGVTGLTLGAPNQPELILQRDPAAPADAPWQLVRRDAAQGPQTQPADRKVVERLLEQLSLLSAQKFQSDAPSDADLENWGFNQPEREVTLTLAAAPNTTRTLKLQIGLTTPRDDRAYARLAGERFIYTVNPAILTETTVSPLAYRERLLRELPATARLTTLKLTDLADGSVVVDRALAEEPAGTPLQALAAQLRTLRVRRFAQDGFVDKVAAGGEERPWRYRLEATVDLPAGTGVQTETETWFFTERIAGTQQLGGSEKYAATFELEQALLDALWAVTYAQRDPGPPSVPTPPAPATVATPQP
ncbi:MAG: DUF4340 domain-containing protein [Opitutaceae bacterium]|nr:DUF4340 domain-containing protein [Opitutaceae bacterium]